MPVTGCDEWWPLFWYFSIDNDEGKFVEYLSFLLNKRKKQLLDMKFYYFFFIRDDCGNHQYKICRKYVCF